MNRADVHHIFPRQHLKNQGLSRGTYNQIANYVIAQTEINIAIGAKSPEIYFGEIYSHCLEGKQKYGGITDRASLIQNLEMNCIPTYMIEGEIPSFDLFLEDRRKLMSLKIKQWFETL